MPTITFKPVSEIYSKIYDPPFPAGRDIPKWYKDQESYCDNIKSMGDNGLWNFTIKRCAPVFDTMSAGYIFTAPLDIYFEKQGESHRIVWGSNDNFDVSIHNPSQVSHYPVGRDYEPYPIKITTGWITITPEHYSILLTHPMWRGNDSPFWVMPGIIDSDSYRGTTNFFMFVKKGFEGTVPTGTPIGQVIPFKRDEWDYQVDEYQENFYDIERLNDRKFIANSYKKRHRKEKIWEKWKKKS